MQGLLDPPLLIGEPGYYLTTLASSVMLLKSLEFDKPHVLPSVGHLQSMLQIHFTGKFCEGPPLLGGFSNSGFILI